MVRFRFLLVATLAALPISGISTMARSRPAQAASFFNDFNSHDSANWSQATWANASPFNNAWRADHIGFDNSTMTITLDDQPCATDPDACFSRPYASGEYRTNDWFDYGRVEARMKPASGVGLISSLFTFSDPYGRSECSGGSNASGSNAAICQHDEIDIEFLGRDTTQVQFNYYKNGVGGNEFLYDLGFDAALSFHDYAFEWRPDRIDWFVDGALAHSVAGSNLPSVAGRILMNLWPVNNDPNAVAWAGPFDFGTTAQPITAEYEWVRYTALADLPGATPVPTPALLPGLLGLGAKLLHRRRSLKP